MNNTVDLGKKIVLQANNIHKTYQDSNHQLLVLDSVSFAIAQQEAIAIVGASGSGKSTLLHILAGLDQADSGSVLINNQPIHQLPEKKLCQVRSQELGFVYQFHHLLPEFTALENTALPLLLARNKRQELTIKSAFQQAQTVLTKLGLAKRLQHKPAELSGGERQRVAIARAIVGQPSCILADEPTGNLDKQHADSIFQLLRELSLEYQCALLMVTHDHELAKQCDKIFAIANGQLSAQNE